MTTVPETFRAYVHESFGDSLQEIKLRTDVKQPQLGDTQVRIKVHAVAMNPIDWKLVEYGKMYLPTAPTPEAPFRMGFDVAGTIVQAGSAVKDLKVGDAVYAMAAFGVVGSFAEYFDLDVKYVAPKPKSLSFNQAAGVPLAAETSYQGLVNFGKIKAGDRVLVFAGSSATGSFAVQIAKALGAFVITTTSSRNTELVKSFGADQIIDYTSQKWEDVIEPHSVDIIYDCGVEQNSWNSSAQRVLKKETGKFVTILKTENPIESPIEAKHFAIMTDPNAKDLSEITKLIDAGKLTVPIDSIHSFDDLLDAVKVQKSNRARGKIIIEVVPEFQ
uniref:Enoyl reductase (ER) domain-containing protein n=1 Tax=Globisporangium ultimum (strain ATCC 200006 / CBS 805.95 / DAOM BR144) TaxID=431595 RepID=K3WJC4_GLOUD